MIAKPCIKCGCLERDTKGKCRACTKIAQAKWRAANPDKVALSRAKRLPKIREWQEKNADRVKANGAAYRAANKEKCLAATAAWNEKNKERKTEYRLAWFAANKERTAETSAAWRGSNKELLSIYKHNRRAREGGGKLSKGLQTKLFELQRGLCACCRKSLREGYHLDHVVPLALGGGNVDSNIQLLCPHCNFKKHAKHPIDFMQSQGFLL